MKISKTGTEYTIRVSEDEMESLYVLLNLAAEHGDDTDKQVVSDFGREYDKADA